MLPHLPGDVIIDILSKLPVKSLKRFSCVCKPWHALLANPKFIKLQLKQNPFKILVNRRNNETKYAVLSLYNSKTIDASVDMSIPSRMMCSRSLNIVGSCNGLLCVSQDNPNGIFLWNPATRQLRSLPGPQIGPVDFTVAFGFGSDLVTDDYKLVRFVCDLNNLGSCRVRSEVYTLSTDCWREIKADMLTVYPLYGSVRFVNGFLYWIGVDVLNKRWCIVSFDVGAELLLERALPNSDPSSVMKLTVCRDSLALFLYSVREELNRCFDLWVMNDHEYSHSWSKLFTIGPFSRVAKPLGLLNNGDVIFGYTENHNGELFLYNPNIKQIKDFPTRGAVGLPYTVHCYVESLVSVEGGNQVAAKVSH